MQGYLARRRTFCEGRRIQTLRAFRRTQGRPEGRCSSVFQNWKSQNVQNGSSETAASVTDGHQIGRKMRPNPVQIRGKNGKNREKIAKHAHTDVKILACWVQRWFLPMSPVPFRAFLGSSWEPKIDKKCIRAEKSGSRGTFCDEFCCQCCHLKFFLDFLVDFHQ